MACRGSGSIMSLLIENGADVNATTQQGKTVMDYIHKWGDEWDDIATLELVKSKFNTQAREDKRRLVLQQRKNILRRLEQIG